MGDLELDPARGQVSDAGRQLELSAREFSLLRYLMQHVSETVSRSQLYHAVWDSDYDGMSNVLDVYIRYLRGKLQDKHAQRITTVRGRGYRLELPACTST